MLFNELSSYVQGRALYHEHRMFEAKEIIKRRFHRHVDDARTQPLFRITNQAMPQANEMYQRHSKPIISRLKESCATSY